ncbi:MAG: ECF transporter S component [Chloroflexota bacterium]|nr:ECF transporter S component [Chloroflexota bacterium]
MRKSYVVLALIFAIGIASMVISLVPSCPLDAFVSWGLVTAAVGVLAIAAFFFEFEARAVSSKEVALVAMLGTLSAVLRLPFAAVPGVQPSTFLVICSGYVFGPVAGFVVGAMTALCSNFFLGQGPWTPYQMLAWGLIGVASAYVGRLKLGRVWLICFGCLSGFLYGWMVNTWFWASFVYPLTVRTFLVTQLGSVWFDASHAVGNALFLGLFGAKTIAILERFSERFNWRFSRGQAGT